MPKMKMLLQEQEVKLYANHLQAQKEDISHFPVVKFFNPCGAGTWLIAEMDEHGIMYGLCDPGLGTPEVGYTDFNELKAYRGPVGLGIERDMHWKATKTLGEYASEARSLGRIAA